MDVSGTTAETTTNTPPDAVLAPEETLRADLYDLLATLMARAPTAEIIDKTATLYGSEGPMGDAINALSRIARTVTPKAVTSEYNALFIGLGRGELLPYASFYLTGFLNEKPLANLRQEMSEIGVARQDDIFEPEDHIATVCEIMAGLIRGRFTEPADLTKQKEFFETHVSPWAGHFFTDLEGASGSVFYAPVGTIGRVLIDVETEAFRMEA